MQTDRPEDRASASLKQLQNQWSIGQKGKLNGMSNGTKTQFNPLPFTKVPNIPDYPTFTEAVCDQSTLRMETVTKQKSPIEAPNGPLPGAIPIPAVPTPILPEMKTLTHINNVADSRSSKGAFIAILPWFYRGLLICATVILTYILFRLQGILDHVPTHPSIARTGIQWAELVWLAPVPLALILWLGWFIFAEAVHPDPEPISLPFITIKEWHFPHPTTKPVRLVFRFVTRGDNVGVLRDSVVAVHQAFIRYPQVSGPYQIEIVSERPVSLNLSPGITTNVYVVPPDYATPNKSRFKARALTYLQKCVGPQLEDWYIYLDEESLIDEKMLAGLYCFVQRSIENEDRVQRSKKKSHPSGLIGQGAILYQGGNWFFRGADALRTADDLGRFRFQYALGRPFFGIHGSYIVIRGMDDVQLSFDVGYANSITEDAAWALRAWAQGYRFAWVEGYLHEQPPQRVKDFVRQRSRWLSGIRAVLRDRKIPLVYRLSLGIFTGLWQLAFLPFLIAVVALFVHASPFYWMRLPADFAWATFMLAYLHGIDIQARHSHPFLKKKKIELFWKRVVSWLLVFCSVWYSLLEAAGVIYSLRPKQGFFVIQKPSLAAENKIDTTQMQAIRQQWNTIPMERKV